jgi:hypothetical protein
MEAYGNLSQFCPWAHLYQRDINLRSRQQALHTWVRSTATQRRAACPGVSILKLFRDKNRGGIGKSQSRRTACTVETPGSPSGAACPSCPRG